MDRVVFINSRDQSLVGNIYKTVSESVIILSHALANDKSERGKLDQVANGLYDLGYSVFAFDFSGCGESDDDTLTVGKQVDDLQSAIRYVQSLGYKNIGLFGHSLGCLVSAKCYTPQIGAMVLRSPVTNKVTYSRDQKLSPEQLQELHDKGYFTRTRKDAVRTTYNIDKQMLIDRELVDQEQLLQSIACPVLLIHGTDDTSVPLTDSQQAIKLLSEDSQLAVVEGADHDFNEHMDVVVMMTNDWFGKYLAC